MIGKTILDTNQPSSKSGEALNNVISPKITPFVDKTSWENFAEDIARKEKKPVQIDLALNQHGLDKVRGLRDYILNNDVLDKGKVNELINKQSYSDIAKNATGYRGVSNAIDKYNEILKDSTQDTSLFLSTIEETNPQLATAMRQYNDGSMNMRNYTKSLITATAKTMALNLATTVLKSAIDVGISFAVSGLITVISNLMHAEEQAIQASNKASDAIANLKSEMKKAQETVKSSGEEYASLAQSIDQLNGMNLDLSTEDYEKFLDISNELAELFPDLVKGYDEEGNAILDLSGNIDEINQKLQAHIDKKKELNQMEQYQVFMGEGEDENGEEREEYFKGAVLKLRNSKSDIDKLKNEKDFVTSRYEKITSDAGQKQIHSMLKKDRNSQDFIDFKKNLTTNNTDDMGLTSAEKQKLEFLRNLLSYEDGDERKKGYTDKVLLSEITSFFKNVSTQKGILLNSKEEEYKQQNAEISQNAQILFDMYSQNADLTDEDRQTAQELFLGGIDWNSLTLQNGNQVNTSDDASLWVQEFLQKISSLTADQKKQFSNLLKNKENGNLDAVISNYDALKKMIDENHLDIKIDYIMDDPHSLKKKLTENDALIANHAVENGTTPEEEKQKLEQYRREHSIDDPEEIRLWNEKTGGASSYSDAVSLWEKAEQEEPSRKSFSGVFNSKDFSSSRDKLLELAEAGELTTKVLKSNQEFQELLSETGTSAEEAADKINNMIDQSKQLASIKPGIASLQDAFSQKKTNGLVGADTFADMEETFGTFKNTWENYKSTLGSDTSSLEQCREAQNQLATAYINSKNCLAKLTDSNKNYYISQLNELGVANSREVVQEALNSKKVDEILLGWDAADATKAEILEKYNEISALEACTQATKDYAFYKALAGKDSLSTSKSVENLLHLANQCGITGRSLKKLQELQALMDERSAIANDNSCYYQIVQSKLYVGCFINFHSQHAPAQQTTQWHIKQ